MNLTSLQPSQSLAGHQSSPAASLPSGPVSGSECFNTAPATVAGQEIEQKTADDDGSWQVVTRRKSRRKGQHSSVVPSVNGASGAARVTGGVQFRHVSASQSLARHSASNRVIGNNQRIRPPDSAPLSLLSSRSCSYWSLCTRIFARFGAVDWASFQACQEKFRQCLPVKVTEDEFLRFHRMMTEGPQAIRTVEDIVFLAGPFKVLLSGYELLKDAVFLSVVFEGIMPGFVKMLGERFISGLSGVNRKDDELFAAITELLARIGQKSERWLNRLGWQELNMRNKCSLFSSMAFIFKHGNKLGLVRSLHRQVSGSWLEKYHYDTVRRLSGVDEDSNYDARLRDLKASVRAVFFWLDGRLLVLPECREDKQQVVCFADIVQSIIEVMDRRDQQSNTLWLAVWQAVAQWSLRFRKLLSHNLGFDRTIVLLNGVLCHMRRWSELESLAFELRLVLLGTALTQCEELLLKRDRVLFSHTWCQHKAMLESLLAKCNQFMSHYQPAFVGSQSAAAECKKEARLKLLLKESAFHRLSCENHKTPRQQIREKLQTYCEVHDNGWSFCCHHREVGVIELAKWYFLADEPAAALRSLTGEPFRLFNMSCRKADLLARNGFFQASVDEYHHARTLMTDTGGADRHKRDWLDSRLAMTQYLWFEAENNTDHLIKAYRLSVDLLGRCRIQDREGFVGGLVRIVNAMKNSGLRFEDYAEQTSVLGYLVKDGCGIKSWHHFADLLYIRHKMGLTGAGAVNKVADEIGGKHRFFIGQDKKA